MSKIEDIMYEAHEGGFQNEIYNLVRKLTTLEKNKFTELSDIYEEAFNIITKEPKKD